MNFRLISRVLGALAVLLALVMLVCDLYGRMLVGTPDARTDFALLAAATVCVLLGGILLGCGRGGGRDILRKEAIAIVGLGWIFAALVGALPYCS